MKVLITGGTGFIGSSLALSYLEMGHSVTVLAQVNTPAEAENRTLIEGRGGHLVLASVTDRAKVSHAARRADIVYHLAAAQHEVNVPGQHFWNVNVTGTKNVLEASVNAGAQRFIHGSTIGVYGDARNDLLDEQSPLHPDNLYGITKLEGERLALSFRDRLPVVVVRISETYGPGDRRLLKLFQAIKSNRFFMIGSGRNLHQPIFIDDLIRGLLLAATAEKAVDRVFILAGNQTISTNEMVAAIATVLGRGVPRLHVPLTPFLLLAAAMELVLRPLGIQPPLHRRRMDFFRKSFAFSQEEAANYLGFSSQYTFRQGSEATARWYAARGLI